MYNVNNCWRPQGFHIFDKCSCITSVGIWGINALSSKIIKFLEISIEYNFLFIGIFEWFNSWKWTFSTLVKIKIILNQLDQHQPSLKHTVMWDVHRCRRATSPRSRFMRTVSATSSALCPVTTTSHFSRAAPLSKACLRKTPQKVQLFFLPTCFTISSTVQP